jgi:hypothetical protein
MHSEGPIAGLRVRLDERGSQPKVEGPRVEVVSQARVRDQGVKVS